MEMEYKKLLLNPKWQKKRLEILQRDNFSCVVCGNGIDTDTHVHVHHLSYMKGRMPWEYDNRLLEDKRWKEFRLKVLSERGDKCECCGWTNILQIHHTFYISGKMPWEYDINDMRVLCRTCHQKIHHLI